MFLIPKMLIKRTLGSSVLVWVMLTVLVGISQMMEEFSRINNYYTVTEALFCALLRLPAASMMLFNPGMIVGSVVGLGLLAYQGELTAIRSLGYSFWRIFLIITIPISLLSVSFSYLHEKYLSDMGTRSSIFYRTAKKSLGTTIPSFKDLTINTSNHSYWFRSGKKFYFIHNLDIDQKLHQIKVGNVDKVETNDLGEFISLFSVKNAIYTNIDNQWIWDSDSLVSWGFIGNGIYKNDSHGKVGKENNLDGLNIDTSFISSLDPNSLSFVNLYKYLSYMNSIGNKNSIYEQLFYKRLLMPIRIFFIILLSISFVFGSTRSVPIGMQIFRGIVIALGIELLSSILEQSNILFTFAGWLPSLEIATMSTFLSYFYLKTKRVI